MSFDNHVIQLNDTKEMPMLGLGVYKATDDGELKQAISSAAALGYRLIDTASSVSYTHLVIPRGVIPAYSRFVITTPLENGSIPQIHSKQPQEVIGFSIMEYRDKMCIRDRNNNTP